MISLFDAAGDRLSVTYNGVEFNDPEVDAGEIDGTLLRQASFSTPTNFASEPIDDVARGGGIEYNNPRVGTRLLSLRGELKAPTDGELNVDIRNLQEACHPLRLQTEFGTNRAGTLAWPPPGGTPRWVYDYPLKFTRLYTKDWDTSNVVSGELALQYHVIPMGMPDPIESDHLQGVGREFTVDFLVMDGGRSFDQTQTTTAGNTTVTWTWGQATVWPTFSIAMAGAGHASYTITVAGGYHTDKTLVLDLSGRSNGQTVLVDCLTQTIYVNGVIASGVYKSGDYPILYHGGSPTVAYTNTTNATSSILYRESDWM